MSNAMGEKSPHEHLDLLQKWFADVAPAYRAYCFKKPHAMSAIRALCEADSQFRRFVKTGSSSKLDLADVWNEPLRRLGFFCDTWSMIAFLDDESMGQGVSNRIEDLKESLKDLKKDCEALHASANNHETLQDLQRKIQTLDNKYVDVLNLLDETRKILYEGSFACKSEGRVRGAWIDVHVVLLDNFLFWGKIEQSKEMYSGKFKIGERLWVLDAVRFD